VFRCGPSDPTAAQYSPLTASLGFTHLPTMYWPILAVTMQVYMALTQLIKSVAAAQELDLRDTRQLRTSLSSLR
jgi:pyrrolidone-carboxylate peptidase